MPKKTDFDLFITYKLPYLIWKKTHTYTKYELYFFFPVIFWVKFENRGILSQNMRKFKLSPLKIKYLF